MTMEDLRSKWARAAVENKVREPYTPVFKRRRLGAKGIGRFSVAKLGSKVKVITRTKNQKDQLVFSQDFRDFTDDRDFDEMKIRYSTGAPRTGFAVGTILEISDLHYKWGKRDVQKVRGQLCHLIDPDRKGKDFSIHFDCSDWSDLCGPLENPISGRESHLISFQIDRQGQYRSEIKGSGKPVKKRESRPAPSFGPIQGVIRYYKDGLRS